MELFVDTSLYRNDSARYSWEMEVKTGKFVQKETKIQETQVSLNTKSRDAWETQNAVENKKCVFCSKFCLSCWTSAFGNPLVQEKGVLVLNGGMIGSFLP